MVFSLFLNQFRPFDLGRWQNLAIWPILTLLKCILMENAGIEVWQFHWGLFLVLNGVVLYPTFWGSFSSWGNNVETWNMISMPLQCVQTECKPVKSCTVSRPPLYLSNPESALVQITIKIISVWMLVLIAPPYFKYKIACLQFLKFSLHSLFYKVCRAVERYDISGGH